METLTSVTVPAHGSARFEPGGYHLMCTSPSAKVAPGARIPVTLSFEDKLTLTKSFEVRSATGR
jgi:copper(I)-binding protein